MNTPFDIALSPFGLAAILCAVGALTAAARLRDNLRFGVAVAGGAAALALFVAAALLVPPQRAARAVQEAAQASARDGEAELAHAQSAITAGRNREAATAIDAAETMFRRAAARDGLARIELARGDLERLQGRLDEARSHYALAANRLAVLGHRSAATALLRQGEMAAAEGDPESARKLYAQAIAAFHRTAQDHGEAEALLADGTLARMAGAFAEASAALTIADALFAKSGDLLGRGRATLELARIAQGLVHRADGARAADAAAEFFRAAGSAFGLVLAPIPAAEAAIDDEERDAAIAGFARAADALAQLADPVAAASAFLGLSPTGVLTAAAASDKAEASATNLAAFPDHHSEARALVAAVTAQIARGRFNADRVQ